jgi:transcriptional regulator with XRE-family HTH domain
LHEKRNFFMTPLQARMARAALQWSIEHLSRETGLAPNTIIHFERGGARTSKRSVERIASMFAAKGVVFTAGDGVRLEQAS